MNKTVAGSPVALKCPFRTLKGTDAFGRERKRSFQTIDRTAYLRRDLAQIASDDCPGKHLTVELCAIKVVVFNPEL